MHTQQGFRRPSIEILEPEQSCPKQGIDGISADRQIQHRHGAQLGWDAYHARIRIGPMHVKLAGSIYRQATRIAAGLQPLRGSRRWRGRTRAGAVIGELVRRALRPARHRVEQGLPYFNVPPDISPLTGEMVRCALDD